jgi:hypothetical protein
VPLAHFNSHQEDVPGGERHKEGILGVVTITKKMFLVQLLLPLSHGLRISFKLLCGFLRYVLGAFRPSSVTPNLQK